MLSWVTFKYMGMMTVFSIIMGLLSMVYEAYQASRLLHRMTFLLVGLLALEHSVRRPYNAPKLKVAIGYDACSDLIVNATDFIPYLASFDQLQFQADYNISDSIDSIENFIETFGYYFQKGAAAERIMANESAYTMLLQKVREKHRPTLRYRIGCNAPTMSFAFFKEGWDVLLGAAMTKKLRTLFPKTIKIAGEILDNNDIHLVMEYQAGQRCGSIRTPRANNYILHNDQYNPYIKPLEYLDEQLSDFQPNLFVITGLQVMDTYRYKEGERDTRLKMIVKQIGNLKAQTMVHFEMSTYVDIKLLQQLRQLIFPYVNSLAVDEQELNNLLRVLEKGEITLAAKWNPKIPTSLDQMRKVMRILAEDYYTGETAENPSPYPRRMITRIHLDTLAYQALLTVRQGKWKRNKAAVAKAALTAHRYICQSDMLSPELSALMLGDSFITSMNDTLAQHITFNNLAAVQCWKENLQLANGKSLDIEICIAPILICRIAKQTSGAGGSISAAALAQQF